MTRLGQQILGILAASTLVWSQQNNQPNNGSDLQIAVIEGEDGANIVSDQTFSATMVEVRDRNNVPILAAGIAVTFVVTWDLTHSGGGSPGTFAGGSNSLTVMTDANGRAIMNGFHPSGNGPIQVQVQASYQGRTASLNIHQTNFPNLAAARAAGKNVSNQVKSNGGNGGGGGNAAAAASTGASAGGHAALITTLVVVGAAGAGAGVAYKEGLLGNSNSGADCTNQGNSYVSATYTLANCESASTNPANQCVNQANAWLSSANNFCSCFGGFSGASASDVQQIQQQIAQLKSYFGASVSAPACH